MEIYNLGRGMDGDEIGMVIDYLKKGMAVEFKCGWNFFDTKDFELYKEYVDGWIRRIEGREFEGRIHTLYNSPDDESFIRISFKPSVMRNDKLAHLLEQEY